MKILMICGGDWGGSAHAMMQAVNETTEHEVRLITTHDGYTKYPKDIFRPSRDEIKHWVDWADVINTHDDADALIPSECEWKPVLQTFRGSWYRQRPEHINAEAKRRGHLTSCMTQGMARFGPEWIGRAMPDLSNRHEPASIFTVIHAPTKRGRKGTQAVIDACKGLEGVVLDLIEGVKNEECLNRKAKGHLLIDQSASGAGTGFCGNALEAWSMGMPVISSATPEVASRIRNLSGSLPFCQAEADLRSQILRFRDDKAFREKWRNKGREYWGRWHAPGVAAKRFLEVIEQTMAEAHPPTPHKISVCMIVKDEEKILKKAIESTKKLADEVVVLDTGSEDGTVALAESLGARVITGGDRWHKGESRNQVIREAAGEWVVVLDADEAIAEPEALRSHLQQTYSDALMIRMTRVKKGHPTLGFHQQRVWRKGAFWYKYRAHELPLPADKKVKPWIEQVPYMWLHDQPGGRSAWKREYTLKRLEMDVQEHPEDPRPIYYLARQYRYMSELDEYKDSDFEDRALELLKKYVEMTETSNAWDRPNGCYDLATVYEKRQMGPERVRALLLACESQPNNRRWWGELARAMFEYGYQDVGIGLMKAALEIPKEREDGYTIEMMHQTYPHDLLAQWCWLTKRYREGYEHIKEALSWSPDSKRLKDNLQFFRAKLN